MSRPGRSNNGLELDGCPSVKLKAMWWLPFVTASLVGVLMLVLQLAQRRRSQTGASTYRARYLQLVSQLESSTAIANHLASYLRELKDEKLIEYYEAGLRILETLLSVVCKLPPFDDNPDTLNSALFLAKDTHSRFLRTQEGFRDSKAGKKVRYDRLSNQSSNSDAVIKGCYFCSRPYMADRFSNVRVKIEGQTKEVISCNVCKEELAHTKKVKVLYFLKDGKPIHWSDIADYKPSEDFWNINKRGGVHKVRRLELVHSVSASPISAHMEPDDSNRI